MPPQRGSYYSADPYVKLGLAPAVYTKFSPWILLPAMVRFLETVAVPYETVSTRAPLMRPGKVKLPLASVVTQCVAPLWTSAHDGLALGVSDGAGDAVRAGMGLDDLRHPLPKLRLHGQVFVRRAVLDPGIGVSNVGDNRELRRKTLADEVLIGGGAGGVAAVAVAAGHQEGGPAGGPRRSAVLESSQLSGMKPSQISAICWVTRPI